MTAALNDGGYAHDRTTPTQLDHQDVKPVNMHPRMCDAMYK